MHGSSHCESIRVTDGQRQGKDVFLMDNVLTTGTSDVSEHVRRLEKAGAKTITCFAIGRNAQI